MSGCTGTTALGRVVPGQPGFQLPRAGTPHPASSIPHAPVPPMPRHHAGLTPLPVPALSRRAGFARQGAKEKQLLKEGNAFNVSSFVLRAMMSGQYWPEGDEVYHAELAVPVLLVHGMHDKFVPVEEDQRMAEVRD